MQSDWTEGDVLLHPAGRAPWAMHYVRTGGGKSPALPALVLQHGFSDNGWCWAPSARELEDTWDVVMPDARGHGKSARVQPGEAIDQAADLAAFVEVLSLVGTPGVPLVVAGHSMGAWIASEFAACFPQLVRGTVLEDPPWMAPHPEEAHAAPARGRQSSLGQWIASMAGMSLDEIAARERTGHPTWPEETLRAWCAAKLEIDPNFLDIDNARRMDWHEVVAAIRCPTLVITADPALGGIVTPEVAAEAQALNPLVQVVNFPGVGHHVRFAVFGPYMEAVKGFLAGL